jgi:hypothetical protein
MGEAEIGLFQALRQMDQLRMRVMTSLECEQYSMPWQKPISEEEFLANLARSRVMTSLGDDLLRHNGVTLSRGGPLNPGFLRMREPYIGLANRTCGREFVAKERERIASTTAPPRPAPELHRRLCRPAGSWPMPRP